MRRVGGWGLFDYLPSLGPEGKCAFLQEVWEHFLDGTFKSYVGQPRSCVGLCAYSSIIAAHVLLFAYMTCSSHART